MILRKGGLVDSENSSSSSPSFSDYGCLSSPYSMNSILLMSIVKKDVFKRSFIHNIEWSSKFVRVI